MAADDPLPSRREIHLIAMGESRHGLFQWFPPATRAELWAGSFLMILSLLGAIWVFKARSEALALERDSVTVTGRVGRLWLTKENNGWHHHVEYEYPTSVEADTEVLRSKTQLPAEYFDRLHEGGPIAVTICRTDPANHQAVGERPHDYSSAAAMRVSLGLLVLLALAGVINLGWWWISHRKPEPVRTIVLDAKRLS